MKFFRLYAPRLGVMLSLALPGTADADGGWVVDRVTGTAWIVEVSIGPIPVELGMPIPEQATVATASNGRVMLSRGEETILLSPDTTITVRDSVWGERTTVYQRTGEIELDVEARNYQHFSVETPLLAAVVKGTHFTVSVDAQGADVSVERGSVEVADHVSGDVADVGPGQRAGVRPQEAAGLTVGGPTPPSVRRESPRPSRVSLDPSSTLTPEDLAPNANAAEGDDPTEAADAPEASPTSSDDVRGGSEGSDSHGDDVNERHGRAAGGSGSGIGNEGNGNGGANGSSDDDRGDDDGNGNGNGNSGGGGNGGGGGGNAFGNGDEPGRGNGNSGSGGGNGNGNNGNGNGNGNGGNGNGEANGNGNNGNGHGNGGGNGNGNSGNGNGWGNGNGGSRGNGNGNGGRDVD
jgi:hypothetical protein